MAAKKKTAKSAKKGKSKSR